MPILALYLAATDPTSLRSASPALCLGLTALALLCLLGPSFARRIGLVIELLPEQEALYRELHANTWQGVLDRISASNLRRYSIFLTEVDPGRPLLFGVYDYVGDDLEKDMAAIAADPSTQAWWKETDPCQRPVPTAGEGVWWKEMEEVFYTSGEPREDPPASSTEPQH